MVVPVAAALLVRQVRPGAPHRILVIRLDLLGDLVMSLPAVSALKATYPEAKITMLVTPYTAPLLRLAPDVDQVIAIDPNAVRSPRAWFQPRGYGRLIAVIGLLRRDRYDVAVSLSGQFACLFALASGAPTRVGYASETYAGTLTVAVAGQRYDSPRHEVDYVLALARAAGAGGAVAPKYAIVVPETLKQRAEATYRNLGVTKNRRIVFHVGASNGSAKRWPVDHWAALGDRLTRRHGASVVFIGAPSDRELVNSVQARMKFPSYSLAGKTDVELLAGILACADVVVTGDSAPVHLASAVGAPVVAIYGPTNPATYGPRGTLNRTISAGLPCGPCYNLHATAECPWNMKPAPCMRAVGVVGVERAVVEILTTSEAIR